MNPDITLEFSGGFLRPLNVSDIHPEYVHGLNDKQVNCYLEVRHTVQNTQTVTEFVQYNLLQDDAVLFGVWKDDRVRHSGTVRLHGIDLVQRTAHIGVCLFDKSAWGKNLGLKAVKNATWWAHHAQDLNRIVAGIYVENVASQKTFLAAGYKWVCDIPKRNLADGRVTMVKIYVASRES